MANEKLKISLKECEESYYFFSAKSSDVARQLSFAGIAIVWMFKPGNNLNILMPKNLLIPILLFSLSLFFDLLHYIYSTIVWGCFHRKAEKDKKKLDDELTIHPCFFWPSIALFSLKLLFLSTGYFWIFIFFIGKQ